MSETPATRDILRRDRKRNPTARSEVPPIVWQQSHLTTLIQRGEIDETVCSNQNVFRPTATNPKRRGFHAFDESMLLQALDDLFNETGFASSTPNREATNHRPMTESLPVLAGP